jgi:ribosomal protein S18 acetylase RimI-like enzyme
VPIMEVDVLKLYFEEIKEYLSKWPELNQRPIETFTRIKSGSLIPKFFKLWVGFNSNKTLNGIAYKLDDHPLFLSGKVWMSLLTSEIESVQGTVEDLDANGATEPNFFVGRNKLIMYVNRIQFKPFSGVFDNALFEVRRGGPLDFEQLELLLIQFASSVDLSGAAFSSIENMNDRGKFYLVVDRGSKQIISCVYSTMPGSDVSRLTFVYTKPEFRRRNLSKALVSHAVQESLNLGSNTCSLFVSVSNTPAISTYEAVGFKVLTEYQIRKRKS